MNIIILGAGQVGSSVAANLCSEANDITVVDTSQELLTQLQDRYDLRTIQGHASHPSVLEQAGGQDADMIIAVTNSDEVNMLACKIADTMFHTPTKIARVRHIDYQRRAELFANAAIGVDAVISPEEQVTLYIQRLIEFPGALQVLDFADGKIQLVGVRAHYGGLLVGRELRELKEHLPGDDVRVAAIFRRDEAIFPHGDTVIQSEDEVFFISTRDRIRAMMSELRKIDSPNRRIMLAGGGNIGKRLAHELEKSCNVKIIESNPKRAAAIADELIDSIVLAGDAADEDLLLEENVDQMDVYCSLTNADEANIISSMLAKRLGARTVMALINRASYVDLVQRDIIDIAISPQQATIGSLLAHVRRGDVLRVHSLRRGAAEAIETIAHGDHSTSQVVGRTLREIPLPPGTSIVAVVRGDAMVPLNRETRVESQDHVILLVTDKRHVRDIGNLFQPKAHFL